MQSNQFWKNCRILVFRDSVISIVVNIMFCEMEPRITESIRQTRPTVWLLGRSIICEKVDIIPKDDVLTSWEDEDGQSFCLRPNEDSLVPGTGDAAQGIIYSAGTSSAVWKIGGMYCKVKAWVEGMESEAETLRFVRERFNDIPIPEVLYGWIEDPSNRSFLLLRPVRGRTLQAAWSLLSPEQHNKAAQDVAQYCAILAKETSDSLETAGGYGIHDQYLLPGRQPDAPSWKPTPLRPLSRVDAKAHLHPMDTEERLHFCHADLSPTNIMVDDDGVITGILDWESAAFYPRSWIGTKPKVSYGFILEDVDGEQWAWRDLLVKALEERQFSADVGGFTDFYRKKKLAP